ncbi:MAG: molybdenum cofactor guanylyltransferase [Betaproteobacteria bacterium]
MSLAVDAGRIAASAAILAGGQSRRMGRNKSLLPMHGQPMIGHIADQLRPHFDELLIGANDGALYGFLGLPVIADREPGSGPLMGILSCLEAARHELLFVTGCDIPEMNLAFIRQMISLAEGHDIVMPVDAEGRLEPLFAIYRKTVIAPALAVLAAGGRRVMDLLPGQRVAHPVIPAGWIRNLNTPSDYTATPGSAPLADPAE